MRPVVFGLLLLFFQSCESRQPEPFASMLKSCDQVDIVLYNGGDTLTYNTKDSTGVKIFVQAISGGTKPPAEACAPVGELRYKSKEQPLMTARFATPESSGKQGCNFVTYGAGGVTYQHLLTDRAHNLLKQLHDQTQGQPQNKGIGIPDTGTGAENIDTGTK
jgi:hypothetical protein